VKKGLAGVNQICRLLGISKDSYYNSKDPESSLHRKYQELKPLVEVIIEENPAYGWRRIKACLEKEYGIVINHKLLLKLLKFWGLSLNRKVREKNKGWVRVVLDFLDKRANLLWKLLRDGILIKCFRVIVSDVTELYYSGKKAYLAVHMDYRGKIIYGWSLKRGAGRDLVIESLRMAVRSLKGYGIKVFKGIILHQDRGSVYTSDDYVAEALSLGFHLSYSRKGEPGDNAVNESFFSRFKEEWRDVFEDAKDFEELFRLVRKAMNYHNKKRYHSSLGYETPCSYVKVQAKLLTQKPLELVR